MLPADRVKGAMLALSSNCWSSSDRLIGQALLAIDPSTLAGGGFYNGRIEALLTAMLADNGARGYRRLALRHRAERTVSF